MSVEITEADEEFWEHVSSLKSSTKGQILQAIADGPKYATEVKRWIENNTNTRAPSIATIAQHLRAMADSGIIECKTPNKERYKIYAIEELGEELLDYIE